MMRLINVGLQNILNGKVEQKVIVDSRIMVCHKILLYNGDGAIGILIMHAENVLEGNEGGVKDLNLEALGVVDKFERYLEQMGILIKELLITLLGEFMFGVAENGGNAQNQMINKQ